MYPFIKGRDSSRSGVCWPRNIRFSAVCRTERKRLNRETWRVGQRDWLGAPLLSHVFARSRCDTLFRVVFYRDNTYGGYSLSCLPFGYDMRVVLFVLSSSTECSYVSWRGVFFWGGGGNVAPNSGKCAPAVYTHACKYRWCNEIAFWMTLTGDETFQPKSLSSNNSDEDAPDLVAKRDSPWQGLINLEPSNANINGLWLYELLARAKDFHFTHSGECNAYGSPSTAKGHIKELSATSLLAALP